MQEIKEGPRTKTFISRGLNALKLNWKIDCEIQVPILNGSELSIPISYGPHLLNAKGIKILLKEGVQLTEGLLSWRRKTCKLRRAKSSHSKKFLKRFVAVRAGIALDSLNPLFHGVFPYPDDLLAFFLSHHTGCFHFFSNVGQKLRSLPFVVHEIFVLIMGRDGDPCDIPLIVPCRGDNHAFDLGYFAWALSQKLTALPLD
jgi:hypothetical protein